MLAVVGVELGTQCPSHMELPHNSSYPHEVSLLLSLGISAYMKRHFLPQIGEHLVGEESASFSCLWALATRESAEVEPARDKLLPTALWSQQSVPAQFLVYPSLERCVDVTL